MELIMCGEKVEGIIAEEINRYAAYKFGEYSDRVKL